MPEDIASVGQKYCCCNFSCLTGWTGTLGSELEVLEFYWGSAVGYYRQGLDEVVDHK